MRLRLIVALVLLVPMSVVLLSGVGPVFTPPVAALAPSLPRAGVVSSTSPRKVDYAFPVDGAIIDPYRPPSKPYGPGNRGVVLATTPGAPVGAPADGVVVFAGQVGGDLFVVILHADGVRTTLGYLATVLVAVGQRVHAGQWVGRAKSSVHFGARAGPDYIDPLSLLEPQIPKVWLIPSRH